MKHGYQKAGTRSRLFEVNRLGVESKLVRVQYLHHVTEIGNA